MCGIAGISYGPGGPSAEDWSPSELLQIMLPAIVHRGPHAYGWMSYNPDSGITISKHVGRCDTPEALATMDVDPDCKWWVGHVRYATHGKPENLDNDHPIVHGSIVGVHNGVLRGWQKIIDVTGREKPGSEVDSEAIFAAVNKWGLRGGLSRIDGDMVTVFASTRHPEILRIARTYGRPLVYATTPAGSLIFASECQCIEATGIETSTPVDLTGRYRMLSVKQGRIYERITYRHEQWRQPEQRVTGSGSGSGFSRPFDGVRGITDAMSASERSADTGVLPLRGRAKKNGGRSATNRDPAGKMGNGDTHLGSGVYMTADGRRMSGDEYIDYRIEQALQIVNNNNQED